jgi:hypothetical protein
VAVVTPDKTYAGLNASRIEELVAERLANAYLAQLGAKRLEDTARALVDRLTNRTAMRLAEKFFDDSGKDSNKTFAKRIIEEAALLLVRQQKEAAREEERRRMVKAIRSPAVPHVLEELRSLALLEMGGKLRNARVPLLMQAYVEFGSYAAVLQQVEEATEVK